MNAVLRKDQLIHGDAAAPGLLLPVTANDVKIIADPVADHHLGFLVGLEDRLQLIRNILRRYHREIQGLSLIHI